MYRFSPRSCPQPQICRILPPLFLQNVSDSALVGLNYTYQQIGTSLTIFPHTARTHTRNVLHKLRLSNQAELRQVLLILEEPEAINLQEYSRHIDQRWTT